MDKNKQITDIEKKLQEATQLISGGKHDVGEKIALDILSTNPKVAQAHYVLGLASYMRKDYPKASEAFKDALKLAPKNPMILSNLGESLRRSQKPEEALKLYQQTLKVAPKFNMGIMGIANCYSDLKQNDKAMKAYQQLLSGNPNFAPAYHYLGVHLSKQDDFKRALPMLRKAVGLRENYTDALMTLAGTLESLDQVDEAVEIFEKLLEKQPNNLAILLNMGNIYKTQGKMKKANRCFDRVLEIDPDNLSVQYSLSHSQSGQDATNIDALEKSLNDPNIEKDARRTLHFTVGKYYDDKGEYSKAFEHFKQGNDMDDRIAPYDSDGFSQGIDQIIATFNKDFFKRYYGMGAESESPIFIVGMPRSGTSLTEQILASHPDVYGAGELKNIGELIRVFQKRLPGNIRFPACFNNLDPITACNLGERYLSETRELSNRGEYTRITDKMPGNTTNLGAIALLLPRARIIHCKRNPMDSCFSNYTHNFASVISYSRQLEDLGKHYRDYHRLMEHWKKVLPLQMMEVRYEDMIDDNEGMSRKLLEFCGLEWDDACLNFDKTERRVKTASTVQVRQPIYKTSVAKWRQYEEQLKPLYNALGEIAPRNENGKDIYL